MPVIERSRLLGCVFLEDILHRNALARRRPHVRYVEVFRAIIVVVEPADTHARADVFHLGSRGDVSKSSVAVVAIKIFPPEIIYHVKIGPAIAVEIGPAASKAVARVVLVETGLGSYIAKCAVAVVAHHEVRRPVVGVIIRRRILILVRALVIDVEAEVDIEPAVAVVIGHRCAGKRSLRRRSELKRIRLLAKLAAAFIQEQHRAVCPHDDQVLPSVVVDIDKKRARGVFDDADARCFRDVLKGSVASISIEPVRNAAGLAQIEVVKSVAIDVANRNAVVAVDIDAASAVEHRAPVVRSMHELRRIGRITPERRSRDVDIARASGAAPRLIQRPPVQHAERTRP